ncbi:MAG: tRNA/rRNA methyltransferase SpoU, partial [uncultured Solirubrobacteraceae bacterium]
AARSRFRASAADRRGPSPATVAAGSAPRPRAARARGLAQRRRSLPLLARGGDRRRARPAPAPVPRGGRELASRLEHRSGGAQRQRLPRRRRPHRRPPQVEPPRRDGHRALPARLRTPGPRVAFGVGRVGGPARPRRRQPARQRRHRRVRPAAALPAAVRPGGARALGRGALTVHGGHGHPPVRLHALHQCRGRVGGGDARVDPPSCRARRIASIPREL